MFEKYHYTDNRKGSPHHYFALMESGRSKIVSDSITIELKSGDIFYIPKGFPYQSYWYSENKIAFKSFGFDYFPESADKQYILQKIDATDCTLEKIKNIPINNQYDSRVLGDFYSFVALAVKEMVFDNSSNDKIIFEKSKRYMIENPDCKMSDVAKHCSLSESALYNVFRKEAKITPNILRQQILCEKAVLMLNTTDKSVQEISDSLGFSSTSYFRKILLKHTSKTPREIRKEAQSL